MFLFLACYQYINTRENHRRLVLANRAAKSNVTITNITATTNVTGTLKASYNSLLGFDLRNANISLFTTNIVAHYVCGRDGVNWTYYWLPHYDYEREFNVGGFVLLVVFACLITLALTGVWPLMLSMSKDIEKILRIVQGIAATFKPSQPGSEEKAEPADTPQPAKKEKKKKKKKKGSSGSGSYSDDAPSQPNALDEAREQTLALKAKHHFRYVWMAAAWIIIFFLAGVLGHVICIFLGLPTIVKAVQYGECYSVDVSDLSTPSSEDANLGKRLDALLDGTEDLPRAQLAVNSDGSVDFVLNCETSMYEAATGAMWTVIPEYKINCIDSPAYRLADLHVDTQQACTWGSYSPENGIDKGTKNGFTDSIEYPERSTDDRCGFLNIGYKWWRAWASWKLDGTDKWQYCKSVKQEPMMVRIDPKTGDKEYVKFQQYLTVDPNAMGRQDGWYTSGDKEVIANSNFARGMGSVLIFYTPNDWKQYFKDNHFRDEYRGVGVTTPRDVSVQPNSLQCKILAQVPDGNKYEEFQPPCKNIWATQGDNGVDGIKIMTVSDTFCTVVLGFEDDQMNTTISIKTNSPSTVAGADRWRCTTQSNFGLDCDPLHPFEQFSVEIVNSSLATSVTRTGAEIDGNAQNLDLGDPFDFLDLSNIGDIFTLIGLALAGLVVLAILGVVIFKTVKCCCKKKNDNTHIYHYENGGLLDKDLDDENMVRA